MLSDHIGSLHKNSSPVNLIQLDGNISDISSLLEDSLASSELPSLHQCEDQFTTLPTIYSANARSLFPKFDDFSEKLLNLRIDVAQISESWQDVNKDDHNNKIATLEHSLGHKW